MCREPDLPKDTLCSYAVFIKYEMNDFCKSNRIHVVTHSALIHTGDKTTTTVQGPLGQAILAPLLNYHAQSSFWIGTSPKRGLLTLRISTQGCNVSIKLLHLLQYNPTLLGVLHNSVGAKWTLPEKSWFQHACNEAEIKAIKSLHNLNTIRSSLSKFIKS